MDSTALLIDLYGRLPDLVRDAVEDLDSEQLTTVPSPDANTIGWLVWHLTRVQDDHIAEVSGHDQEWAVADWPERFDLDPDPTDIGYGHTPEQMAAVRPSSGELLIAYYDAVHANTMTFLDSLDDEALDQVVDTNWDPPVTLGARLISVASDDLQHVGQAAYLRGLIAGD